MNGWTSRKSPPSPARADSCEPVSPCSRRGSGSHPIAARRGATTRLATSGSRGRLSAPASAPKKRYSTRTSSCGPECSSGTRPASSPGSGPATTSSRASPASRLYRRAIASTPAGASMVRVKSISAPPGSARTSVAVAASVRAGRRSQLQASAATSGSASSARSIRASSSPAAASTTATIAPAVSPAERVQLGTAVAVTGAERRNRLRSASGHGAVATDRCPTAGGPATLATIPDTTSAARVPSAQA